MKAHQGEAAAKAAVVVVVTNSEKEIHRHRPTCIVAGVFRATSGQRLQKEKTFNYGCSDPDVVLHAG